MPCHIYVVCCPDGVIVRYDAAGEEEPKVRRACPDRYESLAEMAPVFSEQVIHVSDDPETYVPKHEGGPAFILNRCDEHGEEVEFARFAMMAIAVRTQARNVRSFAAWSPYRSIMAALIPQDRTL